MANAEDTKRRTNTSVAAIAYAVIVLLVHVCFAVCVVTIFPAPDEHNGLPLAGMFGAHTGYFVLSAYWFALQPIRLLTRIVICVITLVAVTIVFGCYVVRTNGPEQVILVMACAGSIQWLLAVIPAWLMRRAGWRYGKEDSEIVVQSGPRQFHLRQLLAWTTAIALLFGVGRVTIEPLHKWLGSLESQGLSFSGFFGILVIGHAVMGGPVIWAVVLRKTWIAWAGIAVFALGTVSYIEFLFLQDTAVGQAMLQSPLAFVACVTASFTATLVSLLLIVRLRGWALVHSSSQT